MIPNVIQHFLKYSSFLKDFKEYYDSHHIKGDKEQYDNIKEDLKNRGRICTDTDDPNMFFVDNGMKSVNIRWDKMVSTGCYVEASNLGYRFTLKVEYENECLVRPLYDILNEYMGVNLASIDFVETKSKATPHKSHLGFHAICLHISFVRCCPK